MKREARHNETTDLSDVFEMTDTSTVIYDIHGYSTREGISYQDPNNNQTSEYHETKENSLPIPQMNISSNNSVMYTEETMIKSNSFDSNLLSYNNISSDVIFKNNLIENKANDILNLPLNLPKLKNIPYSKFPQKVSLQVKHHLPINNYPINQEQKYSFQVNIDKNRAHPLNQSFSIMSFIERFGTPINILPLFLLPEEDLILKKLELSVVFRDNMVTVFGYILNEGNSFLTYELYACLLDIFEIARLRLIHTADILLRIPDMYMREPLEQFLILFECLEQVSPLHLSGSIRFWFNNLKNNTIDINDIMGAQTAERRINLLSNIDPAMLGMVIKPSSFTNEAKAISPKIVKEHMGEFLSNIVGALNEGSLHLSQPLVGNMLLHMGYNSFIPEVDEAERYFANILKENRPELNVLVSNLSYLDLVNPYSIVRAVIIQIIENNICGNYLKESASLILPYVTPPSHLVLNPNFHVMSPIISGELINFNLLFKIISPDEYPDDIVQIKDLLLQAIITKRIDMEKVLNGFIKHDYERPLGLLIALVDRIRRRATLPDYLLEPVSALNSHLKFKFSAVTMEPRRVRGFTHLKQIFDAFKSPVFPKDVRIDCDNILQMLVKTSIDWVKELNNFPSHKYSKPRLLVVNFLNSLKEKQLITDNHLLVKITHFLKSLESDGEPKGCLKVMCTTFNSVKTSESYDTKVKYKTKSLINMNDVFMAVDRFFIERDGKLQTLMNMIDYLASNWNTVDYSNFHFENNETRGAFLNKLLNYIFISPAVSQNIKQDIQVLLRYVSLTGEGEGPLKSEYDEECK